MSVSVTGRERNGGELARSHLDHSGDESSSIATSTRGIEPRASIHRSLACDFEFGIARAREKEGESVPSFFTRRGHEQRALVSKRRERIPTFRAEETSL